MRSASLIRICISILVTIVVCAVPVSITAAVAVSVSIAAAMTISIAAAVSVAVIEVAFQVVEHLLLSNVRNDLHERRLLELGLQKFNILLKHLVMN